MIDATPASDVTRCKRWIKTFHDSCTFGGSVKLSPGALSRAKMLCGELFRLRHRWANLQAPWGSHPLSLTFDVVALLFQIFDNEAKDLEREVCFIDIACDEIPERYYKESEVSNRWGDMWKRVIQSFIQQTCIKSALTWDTSICLCVDSVCFHISLDSLLWVSKWSAYCLGPVVNPGCHSVSV